VRKNPAGSQSPKVTITPDDEGTSIPHVSESISISSSHVSPFSDDTHVEIPVPMPDFDLPDSISESILTTASTSILIPIPPTSLHDVFCTSSNQEATEEAEAAQDQTCLSLKLGTTQGSSWLSSVFEPGDFHFEETFYAPSRSEIEGGRSD
jgi:hypothetical protein